MNGYIFITFIVVIQTVFWLMYIGVERRQEKRSREMKKISEALYHKWSLLEHTARQDLESELKHRRMFGRLAVDGNTREIAEKLKTARLEFNDEYEARRFIEMIADYRELLDIEVLNQDTIEFKQDLKILNSVLRQLEEIHE